MNLRTLTVNGRRKIGRAAEISPYLISNPLRAVSLLKGLHPPTLANLDHLWIKAEQFGSILDVGANTGQFAQVAHHIFPEARIYSFEPLPSCVRALERRMKGVANFSVFPVAVGAHNGTTTIHQSASSPSSSLLSMTSTHTDAFPSTAGSTEIEVELRRLDYYLPQIRFASKVLLKIDVQGYSLEVLRGAPDTLARTDLVVVETSVVTLYEGEARFQDVYELLTETGFEFIGVLDQLNHPRTGEVLQMDAMFRRRGSERF